MPRRRADERTASQEISAPAPVRHRSADDLVSGAAYAQRRVASDVPDQRPLKVGHRAEERLDLANDLQPRLDVGGGRLFHGMHTSRVPPELQTLQIFSLKVPGEYLCPLIESSRSIGASLHDAAEMRAGCVWTLAHHACSRDPGKLALATRWLIPDMAPSGQTVRGA